MNDEDYAGLRGFFAAFAASFLDLPDAIGQLGAIEHDAPKRAATALRLALRDCLELSAAFRPAQIRAADEALAARGLPTLSQVRITHWRRPRAALERGAIRGEAERVAVRGLADSATDPALRARCEAMLAAHEGRGSKRKTPIGARPTAIAADEGGS